MKRKKTPETYEVGYGKPPKATQFKKGVSGNPKGRSKRPLDFDQALLREAKTLITLNENGRRIRVPKNDVVAKQLTNNAMKGIPSAQRMYREALQQAIEAAALIEKARAVRADAQIDKVLKGATEEELDEIILKGAERIREKRRKRENPETEDWTMDETDVRFIDAFPHLSASNGRSK